MLNNLELYGYLNKGFDGQIVRIDTDIHPGFPGFDIIGLPDSVIKESRDRVRTALRNCNFKFPQQHVLVSLSPSSLPKQGSTLDLGIALSILFSSDKNNKNHRGDKTIRIMTAGELSLDGCVVSDNSCIGAIEAAKKMKCNLCVIPSCGSSDKSVFEVADLTDAFIRCGEFLNSSAIEPVNDILYPKSEPVFHDVIGLEEQKRLLSICACGRHSVLLFGPPGVGKTMLSSRISRLLPNLEKEEASVVSHIYGCAFNDCINPYVPKNLIVAHDSSLSQFISGVESKSPGLGALAHMGVLILDEITKYSPKLLEAIKDAYDKGYTISSKSGEAVKYPAQFMLIGNMNACPCGGLGSNTGACMCNSHKIESYWSKIGRPLIERFDVRLPIEEIDLCRQSKTNLPDSFYIEKVEEGVDRQKYRYKECEIHYNGHIHYDSFIMSLFDDQIEILRKIDSKMTGNVRNAVSTIALAQSIADYEGSERIKEEYIFEAVNLKKYGLGDYFWRTIR